SMSTLFGDRIKGFEQILSVQWWHPADELPLHLAITGMKDQKVEAKIFAFQKNRLLPLKAWLPYFLGTFDVDGNGKPETLLRQSFDPDLFWGGRIKQLNLVRGKLVTSTPAFKLPGNFVVLGSLFADLTGNGHPESIFVRNKALYISDGEKQLYRSPPDIGGSLSVATYEVNPNAKELMVNSEMVEVSPATADLDGDGRLEVIAIASDRSLVTAPGISPAIKNTRLATVKLRNGMFVKGTLGENIGKPIQGLTVSRGQLLFVATESGSVFGNEGKSHLLSYPLAR
ncbi:MAG: VCBS repeat-containing protein, partial [Deltaproteobacteria bacterium]|nr:VCBS repeat-containing protein [Deltaproteobacteria bacterium]